MNVPDGNSISAAEHTMALMLALSRNVHLGHITLDDGKWERANLVGNELRNKTLGVIGLGRIGREVIERALSFNMKILGYDPYVNQDLFDIDKVKIVTLDEVTENSDIITVHVPLNDSTKDLFDKNRISKMKKDAKIINVARGGIINESDLAEALNNDVISGAGIDVFSSEPLPKDNPLKNSKNMLLTPHLGASTYEAKEGVSLSICQQIIDFDTPSFASYVDAPRCGVKSIFFEFFNGLSLGKGSLEKTSMPAPEITSLLSASAKSDSFIIPPLATLIILASFFILEILFLSNKSFVESLRGTCTVIISLFSVTSSSVTIFTLSISNKS
jgi:D-3-phosphoglycerate dehydrogenase